MPISTARVRKEVLNVVHRRFVALITSICAFSVALVVLGWALMRSYIDPYHVARGHSMIALAVFCVFFCFMAIVVVWFRAQGRILLGVGVMVLMAALFGFVITVDCAVAHAYVSGIHAATEMPLEGNFTETDNATYGIITTTEAIAHAAAVVTTTTPKTTLTTTTASTSTSTTTKATSASSSTEGSTTPSTTTTPVPKVPAKSATTTTASTTTKAASTSTETANGGAPGDSGKGVSRRKRKADAKEIPETTSRQPVIPQKQPDASPNTAKEPTEGGCSERVLMTQTSRALSATLAMLVLCSAGFSCVAGLLSLILLLNKNGYPQASSVTYSARAEDRKDSKRQRDPETLVDKLEMALRRVLDD